MIFIQDWFKHVDKYSFKGKLKDSGERNSKVNDDDGLNPEIPNSFVFKLISKMLT